MNLVRTNMKKLAKEALYSTHLENERLLRARTAEITHVRVPFEVKQRILALGGDTEIASIAFYNPTTGRRGQLFLAGNERKWFRKGPQ